ncbi:MAG: hypothetical protein ACI4XA_10660, partial [Oscillospiraceae bacterium]
MYKKQMTFQRVICFAVLVASALIFVYSLGLMTDLQCIYSTSVIRDVSDLDGSRVAGARIYYDIQEFNGQLTVVGIVLIIAAILLFITCTHSRRKYYIGNYIAVGISSVCNVAASFWVMSGVSTYRAQYLQMDFEALKQWLERKNALDLYTDSTFWFDVGYVVCAILLVVTALLIVNLVLKIIVMKEEKRLIGSRKDV